MVIAFTPTRILSRIGLSREACWHANVVVSHLILLIAVLFTPALAITDRISHVCLVKSMIGAPCPGCGVTTSLWAASEGDLRRAANVNAAGLCLLISLGVQAVLHAAILWRPALGRSVTQCSRILGWIVLGWLLATWAIRVVLYLC